MKLIRYASPNRPSLTDLERLVGSTFPACDRFATAFDSLLSGATWTGSPAADLYEDDDHYYVKVELPGVKKDDLRVELENSVLTVAAKRATKAADGEEDAEFTRSLSLPDGVDPARITAAYENGVLKVTLPKPEAVKPRRITIN